MSKIVLESKVDADDYCEYLFNNYDITLKDKTRTEVPLPSKEDIDEMNSSHWNIMLICGNSGSGKSTILKEAFGGVKPIEYDESKAVISQFSGFTVDETCDLLFSVGLASVPAWLRKPHELSNGEKARLDLCKAIYDAKGRELVVIDEFTSVVNRSCAKSMSFALQRYARQKDLKFVIASCHFDIIPWLQPDYVFNLNHVDGNGDVELEKMVYSDDDEYVTGQSVLDEQILTKAMEI